MKSTAFKLALTIVGMVLSVLLLRWTHWDAWFCTFLLAFLLSVLYGLDLGQELRDMPNPGWFRRAAGLLFGVPQALLGLTCIVTGGAIVAWVLYNSLVERLPDYTGSFLTFGIGPLLMLAGFGWVRSAFITNKPPKQPPTD